MGRYAKLCEVATLVGGSAAGASSSIGATVQAPSTPIPHSQTSFCIVFSFWGCTTQPAANLSAAVVRAGGARV